MTRASIAERCRMHPRASQALDRCSFEKEQTDAGQGRRREIVRSPLFTPVYGCWSVSVAVPNSPTDRTAIGSDLLPHMSLGNQQIGRKAVLFRN